MSARSAGRNRRFDLFWLGSTVSQFGDRISELALPLIAVVMLNADTAQTAALVAVIWLPNFASPVVGAWIDSRACQRRLMIVADVLRAAALLSLPAAYLLAQVTLWHLFVVAVLTGVGQMVFDVSYPAFFVALVPRADYVLSNSKLSTSRSASFVLGPAVGGALIQWLTAPLAVLVDAMTFLFSAAALSRIKAGETVPAPDGVSSFGRRLRAGLRFTFRQPVLRASLACSTTMNFFMFVGQALVILFASRVLGLSAGVIGAALGIGAVGGLLGALVARKVIDAIGLGRTVVLGAVLYPAPLVLLAVADGPLWLTAAVLGATEWLSGMGVMLFDIANNSLKTAVIPDGMRSRIAGAYSAINYGSRPLGALAGGWLGTALGLRPTLIIAAVGGALGCLWLLASPIPRIAKVPEPGDPVVTES
jgi:MFS family permease